MNVCSVNINTWNVSCLEAVPWLRYAMKRSKGIIAEEQRGIMLHLVYNCNMTYVIAITARCRKSKKQNENSLLAGD